MIYFYNELLLSFGYGCEINYLFRSEFMLLIVAIYFFFLLKNIFGRILDGLGFICLFIFRYLFLF